MFRPCSTDAASGLSPDNSGLIFSVSPREKQAGHRAWRSDHYPSFEAPVIRQGLRVLYELEAHHVHEEANRWVVIADHDGDKAEMHRASIGDQDCSRLCGAAPAQRAPRAQTRPQRQLRTSRGSQKRAALTAVIGVRHGTARLTKLYS